jgi:hypothetical protein
MNYSSVVLVTSILGLISCGATDDSALDSNQPTTTDSATQSTTGTMPLQCDELSVEECLDGPDCRYINGREIHNRDSDPCLDFSDDPVAKGCLASEMGCGEAETYAAPSGDPSDCWWFSNTCIPTGWGACDTSMHVEECDS